jgi:hypothetical protein
VGERGRLAPVRHPELAEDVRDVVLGGLGADHELGGDLPVREAEGEERQHLGLAAREPQVDACTRDGLAKLVLRVERPRAGAALVGKQGEDGGQRIGEAVEQRLDAVGVGAARVEEEPVGRTDVEHRRHRFSLRGRAPAPSSVAGGGGGA